eukprot:gene36406-43334_t
MGGVRILRPTTIELGSSGLSSGVDPYLKQKLAYGVGFQIQTDAAPFGNAAIAFGHDGAGGSMHGAWPTLKTGFSYVTATLLGSEGRDPRASALLAALHASPKPSGKQSQKRDRGTETETNGPIAPAFFQANATGAAPDCPSRRVAHPLRCDWYPEFRRDLMQSHTHKMGCYMAMTFGNFSCPARAKSLLRTALAATALLGLSLGAFPASAKSLVIARDMDVNSLDPHR